MNSNGKFFIIVLILIIGGGWFLINMGGIKTPSNNTTNAPETAQDADSGDLLDDYFGWQNTTDGTAPGLDPNLVDWNDANTIDEITDLAKHDIEAVTSVSKYALNSQRSIAESGYVAITSVAMSADASQTLIAIAPWFGLFGLALVIYLIAKPGNKKQEKSNSAHYNTQTGDWDEYE